MCLMIIAGMLILGETLNHESDLWFDQVEYTIVDKAMHQEVTSKGNTYDDAYVQIKCERGTKWVSLRTIDYLNTNIGNTHIEYERRDDNYRVMTVWFGVLMGLGGTILLSMFLASKMPH